MIIDVNLKFTLIIIRYNIHHLILLYLKKYELENNIDKSNNKT